VGELITQMREPLPGRYMQASLPVQNTAIEKWTLDLEDALFVNDTQEAASMNMPQFASTTVFWMSQPGSVSNLHYDRSHNFYTVVSGAKTITLVPPSEWPFVYLYPWLHPSYHQSQVHHPQNLSSTAEKFPSYREVQNVSVTLRKGDALYIPPYWMHRVETLGGSLNGAGTGEEDTAADLGEIAVAISVVSPSRDEMFYSDAYWKLKPFSEDWDSKLRVIAMHQFLDLLFELLAKEMDGESATEFIQRALKQSRYSQAHIRVPAERMAVPQARECYESSRITDPDTLAIFKAVAANGTQSLKELSSRHILSISLANLIEEMFRFALGGYNMAAHLSACY
jgi:mannose-6-phosphate isomerase-like protein (cupin superfamily)